MHRLRFFIVVLFALVLSVMSANAALALKCAVPELNHQAIEDEAFIFEGRLERSRNLTEAEREAAKEISTETGPAESGGEQAENMGLKVYEYTVTRNWKGTKRGGKLLVLFNASWGDMLNFGEDALIVGSGKAGEMIWVPLCSPSSSISDAHDRGMIEVLREVIGLGYDVKVPGAQRLCTTADDCTAISTHCGGCDCGVPINTNFVKQHQGRMKAYCEQEKTAEQELCDIECEPYRPSCIEGQCR